MVSLSIKGCLKSDEAQLHTEKCKGECEFVKESDNIIYDSAFKQILNCDSAYVCTVCNVHTFTFQYFKNHVMSKPHAEKVLASPIPMPINAISCDICGKYVTGEKAMRDHKIAHERTIYATCRPCNTSFYTKHAYEDHIRTASHEDRVKIVDELERLYA
jgi:hypothetical protein